MIENLGQKTLEILEEFGKTVELGLQTLSDIFSGKTNFRLTFEQMFKIGIESLPVALVTSLFVGMVFAAQTAGEFVKLGAGKYAGAMMGIGIARELGPAIVGMVIGVRIAATIAAEVGTMKVTEQIDALKALGSNPVRYLVIPRFWSCAVMLPLLTIFADLLAFMGGYLVATYGTGINSVQYLETARNFLKLWDIYGGLIKTIVFGMLISVISCYKGLQARGGAKGVGEATTSAVVTSLITLFVVNYFLSVLFFK